MFILLVDNNKFFVSVMKTMLLKAGFNSIESANKGLDCIIQINNDKKPDVIIIDETQCYSKGLDVIEIIRHSLPATRIILLTDPDSDLTLNTQPLKGSIYVMEKNSITADNLPQLLYTIFTEKISATNFPPANKVFSSLRRSFTGMLNF